MLMDYKATQTLRERSSKRMCHPEEKLNEGDLIYSLAPHAESLQTNATKFRQEAVDPLVSDTVLDCT